MAITVGMISLGCPKNQIDAEIMLADLKKMGFELVGDAALAEVCIINTCGFIESAKRESIEQILEMGLLKNEGRIKKIVVTGCLAERYKEEIAKEMFVSPSKLRNTFKAETGITLGGYIDDMVFFRAKKLLGSKKFSVGDISTKLGFCDQFYFSRRFKEKYGKTPSKYRKELFI